MGLNILYEGGRPMRKIAKMDYYAGAFITSLLKSAKGVPALIDETSDSRVLQISTNLGEFNIYIKYAGTSRKSRVKRRNKTSWYVNFTDTDVYKLENEFVQEQCINYVALVLSNRTLTDTRVAIISYDDIMERLTKVTPGGNRGINVIRYGSEHTFTCYGATEQEADGFTIPVNYMRYFEKSELEGIEDSVS
jgi:hypothetical protein